MDFWESEVLRMFGMWGTCLNHKGQITGKGGGCGVFRRYGTSPLPFKFYSGRI